MTADLLQATSIIEAVDALDKCGVICHGVRTGNCGVIAKLSASDGNAWVRDCRTASAAIPGRHKLEFIHEALEAVYNSNDKEFGLVTVLERQCCLKCFKWAYGFHRAVFSQAKLGTW